MRPKLLSLLAVSAIALVGCSAAESAPAAPSINSAAATPTASASGNDESDPSKHLVGSRPYSADMGLSPEEYGFVAHFSSTTAGMDIKKPTEAKVAKALHDYCESGKPFNFSNELDLNKNLAKVADMSCDQLPPAN